MGPPPRGSRGPIQPGHTGAEVTAAAVSHNTTLTSLHLEKAHPISSQGGSQGKGWPWGSACTAPPGTWLGMCQGSKTGWGQGHQLPLHMPFPRTSSCHTHAPLQFPKEGKGFKLNSWISCSKETHSLLPFTQKGAAKGRDRSSCRATASPVPWTALGAGYCWREGPCHAGGQEQEVKAVAPAPSLCISGYQTLGSRVLRICLWLCSDNQEIAIRSASATLYQS